MTIRKRIFIILINVYTVAVLISAYTTAMNSNGNSAGGINSSIQNLWNQALLGENAKESEAKDDAVSSVASKTETQSESPKSVAAIQGKDKLAGTALTGIVPNCEGSTTLPRHPVNLLTDQDPTTSWQAASPGNSFTFVFAKETKLAGISFALGTWVSDEKWGQNCRPSKLRIEVAGTVTDLECQNAKEWQTLIFEEPVETRDCRVTVLENYPGTQFTEECISEIAFFDAENAG